VADDVHFSSMFLVSSSCGQSVMTTNGQL